MYYKEKTINGILHFKNSPEAEWREVPKELMTMELLKTRKLLDEAMTLLGKVSAIMFEIQNPKI